MVDRVAYDWRTAKLDHATEALLRHTERLTKSPAGCDEADIEVLRAAGLSDRAINDAIQVCSYFNYINRIADGLGVDPEDWIDATGRVI